MQKTKKNKRESKLTIVILLLIIIIMLHIWRGQNLHLIQEVTKMTKGKILRHMIAEREKERKRKSGWKKHYINMKQET